MKEHELIRAQEKFIGALLRSPGSVAVVRVAGLTTSYFPPRLAGAFEFALKGDRDRDQTLRSVLEGGEIARLFRLGIPLSHGLALQLGRQIRVSLVRERSWVRASRAGQPLAQTVRPTGAVPDAVATKIGAVEIGCENFPAGRAQSRRLGLGIAADDLRCSASGGSRQQPDLTGSCTPRDRHPARHRVVGSPLAASLRKAACGGGRGRGTT